MLEILIAIIIAVVVSVVLLQYGNNIYSGLGVVAAIFGTIVAIGAGLAAIAYAFVAWEWFAAEHKAQIINREYATEYTREEVFWASAVIDTVRELNRKRIEVNGDLLEGVER